MDSNKKRREFSKYYIHLVTNELLCVNIGAMDTENAKKNVAFFMARCYERGLTTATGGNISMRVGNVMVITPSGLDKASLTPDDIALVDILSGANLTKEKKLSIESEMHRLIYLEREDIYAVCHSHPTFSCLFSASDERVNTSLIAESWYLLDNIKKVEYARMGTKDLAEKVGKAVRDGSNALLLAHHGALTLGSTLLSAFDRLECLEQAAKLTAMSHLIKTDNLSEEEKKEIAEMR